MAVAITVCIRSKDAKWFAKNAVSRLILETRCITVGRRFARTVTLTHCHLHAPVIPGRCTLRNRFLERTRFLMRPKKDSEDTGRNGGHGV